MSTLEQNTMTNTDIGQVLVEIYQLEGKLGNSQELKNLKRHVLTNGVDEHTNRMIENLRAAAAPVKSSSEYREELATLLLESGDDFVIEDVEKKAIELHISNIDIDLDEWGGYIQDWHTHCSGKPFFKNLIRVVSDRRLDDNNLKVIKAISSAYTHLAIEAEQNMHTVEFFDKVGESLLKCSTILHSRRKELYPLVTAFLTQLFGTRM